MKAFSVFKVADIAMAHLTFEFKDWFISFFEASYKDASDVLCEDIYTMDNVMDQLRDHNLNHPDQPIKDSFLSLIAEIELCCKQNKCDYFRIVNE